MPEPGYVYVLFNPSLKGLVKIGGTARDPKGRAEELSSATGVPTPFEVAFEAYFADAVAAEQFVHATLTEKGFRRASNREFFDMSLYAISTPVRDVTPSHREALLGVRDRVLQFGSESEPLKRKIELVLFPEIAQHRDIGRVVSVVNGVVSIAGATVFSKTIYRLGSSWASDNRSSSLLISWTKVLSTFVR